MLVGYLGNVIDIFIFTHKYSFLRQVFLIDCAKVAKSLIRIKGYRDCLVTILIIFILIEDIKVIGLGRHLIVVVGLLQSIDSLGNLAHLFDCLINLTGIFEESLTRDEVIICGLVALSIVVRVIVP